MNSWLGQRAKRIVRESEIDMYTPLYLKWVTNQVLLYIAQGTLFNVIWWPGWKLSLGENGYLYMYGCPPETHNIVNWVYSKIKLKVLKIRKDKQE